MTGGKLLQQDLLAAPIKLVARGEPSAQFDQEVIKQWHAELERVPHAQLVRQRQNVLRQIGLDVDIEGPAKIVRSITTLVRICNDPVCRLEIDLIGNTWRKQLPSFFRKNGRGEAEIAFGRRLQRRRRKSLGVVYPVSAVTWLGQPLNQRLDHSPMQ